MSYNEKFHAKLQQLSCNDENYLDEWIYAGGDTGRHLRWFNQYCKGEEMPSFQPSCICTHEIKENCFIKNKADGRLIVVGNCCIKRYISKENAGRTCKNCGKPHKNRITAFCNECREDLKSVRLCFYCGEKNSCKTDWCARCRGERFKGGQYEGMYYFQILNCDKKYCYYFLDKYPRNNFSQWLQQHAESSEIFTAGKYRLYEFQEILEKDRSYCLNYASAHPEDELMWWLKTYIELTPEELDLLNSTRNVIEEQSLKFGKHKGKTFKEVLAQDPSYCNWVRSLSSADGQMLEFQRWLIN